MDSIDAYKRLDDIQVLRVVQSEKPEPVQQVFEQYADKALGISPRTQ